MKSAFKVMILGCCISLLPIGCRATDPELYGTRAIFVGQVLNSADEPIASATVRLEFSCEQCGFLPQAIEAMTDAIGRYRMLLFALDHPSLDASTAKLVFSAPNYSPDSVTAGNIPFHRSDPAPDSVLTNIKLALD